MGNLRIVLAIVRHYGAVWIAWAIILGLILLIAQLFPGPYNFAGN